MLLQTEHLTKDYNSFRALDDLNLGIAQGEIFGLLGPNGSGKSTTLRLLLGFLRPTAGRATIGVHDCWRDSVAVRKMVAYLPGELRLYENMTGRQLLSFLAGLRGQRLGESCDRLAKRFDIDLSRPIASLSSGMKRKIALMQVLLPQAPLLILDEPTNTLDPTMRDELLNQLVAAKAHGQTVLFSSHVLQEVERVCDRVGILAKGRLVHLQTMNELRQGRVARIRLAHPMQSPPPAGVIIEEERDGRMTLVCRGEPQPLLQWLAAQAVTDVQVEPLGLGPVYSRFHSAAEVQ
jgi:ABC-2 type transport system ATP-binding protein